MQLTPVSGRQRYEFLDVLRGFALIGIILANMISYSLYLYLPESAPARIQAGWAGRSLDFLELALVEEKFFTIFSVLFGVGFSILLSRAREKSLRFHRFFLRRIAILFLIGIAHTVLFWHNDILVSYAVCGALLLPLLGARDRTILACAAVALLAPLAIDLAGGISSAPFIRARDVLFARFGVTPDTLIETWTHGSIVQIWQVNFSKWLDQIAYVLTSGMLFKIYGCFLIGFYFGRNQIHARLGAHRTTIKRVAVWGIAIGLPLNILYASTFDSESWLYTATRTAGILPLSAGYAAWLCVLWLGRHGATLTRVFAPVGRMALSNYVGQSVICTLIFYGTGLGLGGTMGPAQYLPLGLAVYAIQVVFSRLWLANHQYGPLEWVWRVLTYGALPRRASDA